MNRRFKSKFRQKLTLGKKTPRVSHKNLLIISPSIFSVNSSSESITTQNFSIPGGTLFTSIIDINAHDMRFFNLVTCKHRVIGQSCAQPIMTIGSQCLLPSGGGWHLFDRGFFTVNSYQGGVAQKSRGLRIKVRGVAKNPVDHPNGGRANTKGSFKTPWGKIAKSGK